MILSERSPWPDNTASSMPTCRHSPHLSLRSHRSCTTFRLPRTRRSPSHNGRLCLDLRGNYRIDLRKYEERCSWPKQIEIHWKMTTTLDRMVQWLLTAKFVQPTCSSCCIRDSAYWIVTATASALQDSRTRPSESRAGASSCSSPSAAPQVSARTAGWACGQGTMYRGSNCIYASLLASVTVFMRHC